MVKIKARILIAEYTTKCAQEYLDKLKNNITAQEFNIRLTKHRENTFLKLTKLLTKGELTIDQYEDVKETINRITAMY